MLTEQSASVEGFERSATELSELLGCVDFTQRLFNESNPAVGAQGRKEFRLFFFFFSFLFFFLFFFLFVPCFLVHAFYLSLC